MPPNSSRDMLRFNYLLGETAATYHDIARRFHLTDSAMDILYAICDVGSERPLHDICRQSALSKQTINSALRKLESEGFVYLKPAGRGKIVCLTPAGQSLAARTILPLIEAENRILASWTPEEVHLYLDLTERYLSQLREKTTFLGETP